MLKETKSGQGVSRFPLYLATVFAAVVFIVQFFGGFQGIDNKWTDQMFRWRGMQVGDKRITIVTIDDESIKQIGQYPWPRSVYARMLDNLFGLGAKVVGLDVMFLDLSQPKRGRALGREDQALVEATRKWSDRLVHAVFMPPPFKNVYKPQYPFPELQAVTKRGGVVNQELMDGDGEVRRTWLLMGTDAERPEAWTNDPNKICSFGLQILSVFEGKSPDDYVRGRNQVLINYMGERTHRVPRLDAKGNPITDAHGNSEEVEYVTHGIESLPAHIVAKKSLTELRRSGELSKHWLDKLNGGIVLVGSSAQGAYDHYPSPFTAQMPGVEVYANVIDNVLNRRELQGIPQWVTLLFVFSFAFLTIWLVELPPLTGTSVTIGLFVAWTALNYYEFLHLRVLNFVAPSLALIGPFGVLLVRKTRSEQQEKRFIKQTFGQFVAPEVVDDLVKDPSKVQLGGEKRDMTVFFLDIAHFTTISEKMKPEALILFLNKYLSALSHIIHEEKGVVDKYIGDCIMAFWNAPLELKDHRAKACLAAVQCQEVMAELNKNLDPSLPERPAIRIGVNSGDMTVGLTGSEKKLQYTVIGDEVNLASRLEGANKFFGSKIMASESCYSGARGVVEARELGRVRVVGKDVPIRVYELLAQKGKLSPAWQKALPLYNKGLELFQKGVELAKKKDSEAGAKTFAQAKAVFAEVLKEIPGDGPAKFYMNASEDYSQIPPSDWEGVFNLTAK